jgi:hypothetical protein
MLTRVALVRTDVSEEHSVSVIRVLGILLALISNAVPSLPVLFILIMEGLLSSETSAGTGATRHNIPEDDIPHSHRCENLKSCITLNILK